MKKIGIIGSGNMAEAMINGLISSGRYKKEQVLSSDISEKRLKEIHKKHKIYVTKSNIEVAAKSDLIFIAVKPDSVSKVLKQIKAKINSKKIIISIAAGIKTSLISKSIGKKAKIVRVMPNTPALVNQGVSVLYPNALVTDGEVETIRELFESVGYSYIIHNEDLLDAVTGLSGSGPAYVAMFIDALADGGVKMGLPKYMSLKLAAQTVLGTASMVLETEDHPSEFKDKVSSPAGTTVEGLHQLELGSFRGTVISAVEAATKRSRELSKEN